MIEPRVDLKFPSKKKGATSVSRDPLGQGQLSTSSYQLFKDHFGATLRAAGHKTRKPRGQTGRFPRYNVRRCPVSGVTFVKSRFRSSARVRRRRRTSLRGCSTELMVSKRFREVACRTADMVRLRLARSGLDLYLYPFNLYLRSLIWFTLWKRQRLVVRSVWFPTLASQKARR